MVNNPSQRQPTTEAETRGGNVTQKVSGICDHGHVRTLCDECYPALQLLHRAPPVPTYPTTPPELQAAMALLREGAAREAYEATIAFCRTFEPATRTDFKWRRFAWGFVLPDCRERLGWAGDKPCAEEAAALTEIALCFWLGSPMEPAELTFRRAVVLTWAGYLKHAEKLLLQALDSGPTVHVVTALFGVRRDLYDWRDSEARAETLQIGAWAQQLGNTSPFLAQGIACLEALA